MKGLRGLWSLGGLRGLKGLWDIWGLFKRFNKFNGFKRLGILVCRCWRRFVTGVCIWFSKVIKDCIRNFRFVTGVIGFNKFSSTTVETVGYGECRNVWNCKILEQNPLLYSLFLIPYLLFKHPLPRLKPWAMLNVVKLKLNNVVTESTSLFFIFNSLFVI